MTLEILALGTRVGGSRSPQRDGKRNRGFAAHLLPSSSEKPIHPRSLLAVPLLMITPVCLWVLCSEWSREL